MPVPNSMADLAQLASANFPTGTESIGNNLDNYLRAIQSIVRSTNAIATATIASASTTDIGGADAEAVTVTGSATINSFGTGYAGCRREVYFTGACTIVNSSNIALPYGTNVLTAAGESFTFRCQSPGVWLLSSSGRPSVLSTKGTVYGDSLGTGAVAAFAIGNDVTLWDVNQFATAAVRGVDPRFGRLAYGNRGEVFFGVSSSNETASEIGLGQFHQATVAAGAVHYSYCNSQHIAQYKRAGTYGWYWRKNSTGTSAGTGEVQLASLDDVGNFLAAGDVTGGSDERVKTNWRDLPRDLVEGLAELKRVGTYDRTDIGVTQTGVGAQSLREILPHTVHEDEQGFLSVAYGNAALVGAVAVARRLIALEERVKDLEDR